MTTERTWNTPMPTILTATLHVKTTVDCPACGGSGYNSKTKATCKTCKGSGKITADV